MPGQKEQEGNWKSRQLLTVKKVTPISSLSWAGLKHPEL